MSLLTKTLLAAAMTLTLAGGAFAADTEWHFGPNDGYIVDMSGKAMVMKLGTPTKEMMARAQEVQRGTIFFMHEGKLMMVFDRGMVQSNR